MIRLYLKSVGAKLQLSRKFKGLVIKQIYYDDEGYSIGLKN